MPQITVREPAFLVIYDNAMTPKCKVFEEFTASEAQPQTITTPYPECDLFAVCTEYPTLEEAETAARARAEELGWVFEPAPE